MNNKEILLALIDQMEFLESYEIAKKCPKCKRGKVVRHIRRETQQSWGGRWYVEYCRERDCDYLDTGFTPKNYNPKNPRRLKVE